MTCAEGFIGIRQACTEAGLGSPASGLYIEDLEGISVKNLEAINAGKWGGAVDMVNQKTQHAVRLVAEDLRARMEPRFQEELVLETNFGGLFDKDPNYNTLAANDYGLRAFMVNNNLRTLCVNEIFLLFEADFNKTITITDGTNTKTINSENEVIAKAGEVARIQVDFMSSNGLIDITYAGTGVSARSGSTSETQYLRSCSSCGSVGFENFTVKGLANDTEDDQLYGIRGRFSVECSMEKALCLSLHKLKMPILYKLGIELLKEWGASDRMNFLTIHSQEWALDKRAEWEEITYPNLMDQLASGVGYFLRRVDQNCFNCGGLTYGNTHP